MDTLDTRSRRTVPKLTIPHGLPARGRSPRPDLGSVDVHLMCKFWYYADHTDYTDDLSP